MPADYEVGMGRLHFPELAERTRGEMGWYPFPYQPSGSFPSTEYLPDSLLIAEDPQETLCYPDP